MAPPRHRVGPCATTTLQARQAARKSLTTHGRLRKAARRREQNLPYLAGGRMTASITWITPLLVAMSVFTMLAASIFGPPAVLIFAEAP